MEKFGLKCMVINSDTIHEAQLRGEDIWEKAVTEPNILFMAPEQLVSPGFNALTKEDGEFAARVCAIAVDEAHLLNTWGKGWRKHFRQIGWVRAQFSDVVLVAMTATMREGRAMESVCQFLGLHQGRFHLIRRSNARPDIQILFRTMKSGLGGKKFLELDRVMDENRKSLIFCRTIHLGWRLHAYLRGRASDDSNIHKRIRLYNSLNWPEHNSDTRKLMEDDADCLIVIGTDTLSVGVDLSCVEDVIVIGEPEDIDDLIQKFGRVGRDRTRVLNARGILYLGVGANESAQRIVDARTNSTVKLRKGDTMDISIAEMVLAKCKYDEQDRQYNNPKNETPCTCRTKHLLHR
jgi:superfamily II DNA helicase RecQ